MVDITSIYEHTSQSVDNKSKKIAIKVPTIVLPPLERIKIFDF